MTNKSPFSAEYDIDDNTDSQPSGSRKSFPQKGEVEDEFIKKIEEEYQLSKPRRKIIRARIIPQ